MKSLDDIKLILVKSKKSLKSKYKIKSLGIFGSYSRGEAKEESDIDILVEFEEPIGLEFIDLADELEQILNHKVDLVSKSGIRDKYLQYVQKELIYV
jgi:predicted nucleotidyltransferase